MNAVTAAARRRKSYRLLVWSGRVVLFAGAAMVLTQVLWANHMISHAVLVVMIAPLVLVACASALVMIAAIAIQAAYFSSGPIGRGPIQRQTRFSRMFVEDLLALPWNLPSRHPKK